MENLIGKEFSKTKFNVMTRTSMNGSITKKYRVIEELEDGYFKCEVLDSDQWFSDDSYPRGHYNTFHKSEILKEIR